MKNSFGYAQSEYFVINQTNIYISIPLYARRVRREESNGSIILLSSVWRAKKLEISSCFTLCRRMLTKKIYEETAPCPSVRAWLKHLNRSQIIIRRDVLTTNVRKSTRRLCFGFRCVRTNVDNCARGSATARLNDDILYTEKFSYAQHGND